MREHQSLDSLVAKKAVEFADQIKAAAAMADKEEEIRIEVERQLAFIQKEAGVKLEGRHEFTVASGRVDSVYDRVIIEYKNPRSPGDRVGPRADSPGTKKVVEQIKRRFYDMRSQFGQPLNTLFGVGLEAAERRDFRFPASGASGTPSRCTWEGRSERCGRRAGDLSGQPRAFRAPATRLWCPRT